MKAETSVRAIVVSLPGIPFPGGNCVVTNTRLCYLVLSDGSQDRQHDGQEKWIVEDCRYRGRELADKVGQWRCCTLGEQLFVARREQPRGVEVDVDWFAVLRSRWARKEKLGRSHRRLGRKVTIDGTADRVVESK